MRDTLKRHLGALAPLAGLALYSWCVWRLGLLVMASLTAVVLAFYFLTEILAVLAAILVQLHRIAHALEAEGAETVVNFTVSPAADVDVDGLRVHRAYGREGGNDLN